VIKETVAVIGLIGTIAGGVYVLEARYESRENARQFHAGLQDQYQSMRLNQVDNQIVQLEREARSRRLTEHERNLLQRLYREQKMLLCQLKIEKC